MKRNELLSVVYGSSQTKILKPLILKEAGRVRTLEQLSNFAQKWNLFMYYDTTINTLKSRVTEFKNDFKDAGLRVEIINLFNLPTSLYQNLNNKANAQIKEALLNTEGGQTDFLSLFCCVDKLIKEINDKDIEQLSNNSRPDRELSYKKLVVVALATGRRQVEILKTMTLNKKKENALYGGLVKKKSPEFAEVIAPILADINLIKKYLKDIREEFKTESMTNKEINSKYNASIGKSLSRYLPDNFGDNKNFHFLRTVYAEVCYIKFGGNADKNIYFGDILGHEDNLNAAHSYQSRGVRS